MNKEAINNTGSSNTDTNLSPLGTTTVGVIEVKTLHIAAEKFVNWLQIDKELQWKINKAEIGKLEDGSEVLQVILIRKKE